MHGDSVYEFVDAYGIFRSGSSRGMPEGPPSTLADLPGTVDVLAAHVATQHL